MKPHFPHNLKLFLSSTAQAVLVYLFLLLLFAAFRIIILLFFNNSPEIYNETSDLLKAFFTGFRFDTMVIFYGLLPVMVLNLIGVFTSSKGEKYYARLKRIYHVYYTVLIMLMLIISVIDLYFYNFFMTRISVLIFGFVEDDTLAVLKAIWVDYPVIPILIGLIVAGWCAYKLVGYIQKVSLDKVNTSVAVNLILLVVVGFFFVFGIRGTFAFYPLKINDAIVSQYVFINNLVPNGVYALKTAFKDRKEQDVNVNTEKTMKKWGFASADEAISLYTGRQIPDNADSLKMALMDRTPVNDFLAQNKPNVVFVQMESMSEHFISMHDRKNFNLLGALEDVLPDCIHFTHCLSATDATIHTLEGIMLNSPMTPVSQSIYMDKTLETSAAKPFKEQGYHTAFITGSKLGWRNLDKFIPHQYFDTTEGSAHIEKNIPHTLSNEWGCYDEFMFDRMYNILQSGSGQPQFIFGMSITNHTPYSLPKTYKPYMITIPDAIKPKFSSGEAYAQTHFSTYQYANDCLGRFIKKVKESPLGENTIIVATGDHTARRIFDYNDSEMLQKYAVPLIIYIPEKYRALVDMPDVNGFASHKDIFPTIYNLSLSDATYVKSGVNLFDKDKLASNFAITGYKLMMTSDGCVFFDNKPVYYTWKDDAKTQLQPASGDVKPLENGMKYAKSYTASMTYLIQRCLSDK